MELQPWGTRPGESGEDPLPYLQDLYLRAGLVRAFPAYKLEELDDAPVAELLQALELMETAQKVLS